MDDFDNLNSKTDSDLRQIAVAFGDFTPEEAESKTRDELIMAITGAKNIGDVTVVDLAEDPIPVKPVSIPEPVKSTEKTKSLNELIEDVGRTARFETNELADALLKAERAEESKVATKEPVEEKKEQTVSEPKEEKKPVKRTRKTKAKAEEKEADPAPKAEETAPKAEAEAPAKAKEAPKAAEPKASKKSGKKTEGKAEGKTTKARGGKKKEAKDAPDGAAQQDTTPTEE